MSIAPTAQSLWIGHAVVLDLDEEVLLAEDLLVPGAQPLGLGRLAVQDEVGELGGGAAGQADQAVGVALEDLLVDPGLVIEALEERERREPHQVPEARGVPGQQRQMEGVLLPRDAAAGLLRAAPGRHIGLQADDRHDAGILGLAEELDGAVEVAVVGERHRGHPQRLDALDQLRDLAGPVEQAVVAVAVEMDKGSAGHRRVTRARQRRRYAGASGADRPHLGLRVEPTSRSRSAITGELATRTSLPQTRPPTEGETLDHPTDLSCPVEDRGCVT